MRHIRVQTRTDPLRQPYPQQLACTAQTGKRRLDLPTQIALAALVEQRGDGQVMAGELPASVWMMTVMIPTRRWPHCLQRSRLRRAVQLLLRKDRGKPWVYWTWLPKTTSRHHSAVEMVWRSTPVTRSTAIARPFRRPCRPRGRQQARRSFDRLLQEARPKRSRRRNGTERSSEAPDFKD